MHALTLKGDLNAMGLSRYRVGKHWRREYHKHFPISAPEDDYEDRMALYELSVTVYRPFHYGH
jgi:hypothetical protein